MALPVRNSRIRLSQGLLFWREVGQGEALVFLHGSWHDSSQWMPLLEQLRRDYHCFAPDLLGCGESEYPNVHYSIDLEVECLAEWLRSLKLRQVYLIGHSLGGWVAASFALKYREQVAGLVLLAPEGVQTEGNRDRWSEARLLLTPWLTWMWRSLLPLSQLLKLKGLQHRLQRRKHLLQFLPTCELLFRRRQVEIKAELLDEQLGNLTIPLLILQGDRDGAIATTFNQTYVQLAPKAEMEMIPQATEAMLETQATVIAQRIRAFVARVPLR